MLRKSEIMLLTAGLLVGAVAGLVVGYGIHDTPAQGSIGTIIPSGDGYFSIDGERMDLGSLRMRLEPERTTTLDWFIWSAIVQIQDRNNQIGVYNEQMASLTAQRAALDPNDSKYQENYASLTARINYLKGLIDGLNSENKADMIRLDDLIEQRNRDQIVSYWNKLF